MTGLFWAVAAAALALDVGSKLWAVHSLGQRVTVLPGVLELRLSRNDGMALGLLSGNWLANLLLPLIVITMLLLSVRSIIHRRDTSLRRQLLAAVLLLGIGSWHQYYPVPCVRHVYWAALPMFGAYVLLMQMIRQLRWRPPARWALLLAAALLITPPVVIRLVAGALRLNGATARVYVSIPGIRGMLLFPSEAAAVEAISSAFNRQPAELRERGLFNHTNDGLFSIIARDAGYPRPMFVNWERGVYPDYPERARDFVAAKRPVVLTTEPGDQLPFPGYFNDLEFVWNEKRFRMLIPEEFAPAVRR